MPEVRMTSAQQIERLATLAPILGVTIGEAVDLLSWITIPTAPIPTFVAAGMVGVL